MIRAIKNIIFATRVCAKYNVRYIALCGIDDGSFDYVKRTVKANPFNKKFYSIFLHEIGHVVHDRFYGYPDFFKGCVIDGSVPITRGGENYHLVLKSEAFASRFSIKAGKSGTDKFFLNRMFNSYTCLIMKKLNNTNMHVKARSEIVNTIASCYKMIH